MITLETLHLFEDSLRGKVPNLKIRFKDESLWMKLIGMLISPFNPNFAKDFITTMGSTIYFPSKASYEADPGGSFQTIAHEFVHIWDSQQDSWFKLKYMFPQSLALVPVAAYGLLAWKAAWVLLIPILGYVAASYVAKRSTRSAFVATVTIVLGITLFVGWLLTSWKMLVLLGLGVVAPWPAPWRANYELRGYGMTVAFVQWVYGHPSPKYMSAIGDNFDGPSYYFMCRDRAYVDRTLEATRQQAEGGALQKVLPYSHVYDFLYQHSLLHRPA